MSFYALYPRTTLISLVASVLLTGCGNSKEPPKAIVEQYFTRQLTGETTKVTDVANIKCKPSADAEGRYLCFADVGTANSANGQSGTMRYALPLQKRNDAWFLAGMIHRASTSEQL